MDNYITALITSTVSKAPVPDNDNKKIIHSPISYVAVYLLVACLFICLFIRSFVRSFVRSFLGQTSATSMNLIL